MRIEKEIPVTETKKVLTAVRCDKCGCLLHDPMSANDERGKAFTSVPVRYYSITTGHNDWGNDSCESREYFDLCSACTKTFVEEHLNGETDAGKSKSGYIEIMAEEGLIPNYNSENTASKQVKIVTGYNVSDIACSGLDGTLAEKLKSVEIKYTGRKNEVDLETFVPLMDAIYLKYQYEFYEPATIEAMKADIRQAAESICSRCCFRAACTGTWPCVERVIDILGGPIARRIRNR